MGKPGWARVQSPAREPTLGTETSQYPEEEKSTEIPSVAVSERGRGQTVGAIRRGCGTATWDYDAEMKRPGMARHRR